MMQIFIIDWENIFDYCTKDLVLLLLQKRQTLYASATLEIKCTLKELHEMNTHPEYKGQNNRILTNSQTLELEIITCKKTKLFRERNDKLAGTHRP